MVRQTGVQSQVESCQTQEMVLDAALLSTQQYKVRIKGKVEQFWERSSALPLHLGVVAIEKEVFGSPSTKGRQLYFYVVKTWEVFFRKSSDITVNIHLLSLHLICSSTSC